MQLSYIIASLLFVATVSSSAITRRQDELYANYFCAVANGQNGQCYVTNMETSPCLNDGDLDGCIGRYSNCTACKIIKADPYGIFDSHKTNMKDWCHTLGGSFGEFQQGIQPCGATV